MPTLLYRITVQLQASVDLCGLAWTLCSLESQHSSQRNAPPPPPTHPKDVWAHKYKLKTAGALEQPSSSERTINSGGWEDALLPCGVDLIVLILCF